MGGGTTMVGDVARDPVSAGGGPFLSAVAPLNDKRRNDALYLLAKECRRPLTPYDICKTLVLADVRQLIESGRVIFGGRLFALPYGPVESRTLNDCKNWSTAFFLVATLGYQAPASCVPLQPMSWRPGANEPVPEFGPSPHYDPSGQVSWEWFADAEVAHLRRAHEKVMAMGSLSAESQRYFHEPVSAIGYAYAAARSRASTPLVKRVEMNWFDVLDGAEKVEKADVSYARAMLGLWA